MFRRSGIIPYTYSPTGEVLFCFGIDRRTGDYSDWGGSIECREDKVNAAIRELKEEMRGILMLSYNHVATSTYIKSERDRLISFLVNIPYQVFMSLPAKFAASIRHNDNEMRGMKIMTLQQLARCIWDGKFYRIVERAMIDCGPVIYELCVEN